jgi:hypothetical protein
MNYLWGIKTTMDLKIDSNKIPCQLFKYLPYKQRKSLSIVRFNDVFECVKREMNRNAEDKRYI